MKAASIAAVGSVLFAAVTLFQWEQLGAWPREVHVFRSDMHAWWVVLALSRDEVTSMLPRGAHLRNNSFPGVPANQHPVFLKMGWEDESGLRYFEPAQYSYGECSLQVPDVGSDALPASAPALVKVLTGFTEHAPLKQAYNTYRLNGTMARIAMAINSYRAMLRRGRTLQSVVPRYLPPKESAWVPARLERHFAPLREALDRPWFGFDPRRCGVHAYQWESALVLPTPFSVRVPDHTLVDAFPMGEWTTPGMKKQEGPIPRLGDILAAYEVKATYTTSLPFACEALEGA